MNEEDRIVDFQDAIHRKLVKDNNKHTEHEEDPEDNIFHASWMGYCKRQVYISKCGLGYTDPETLGKFRVGTEIHRFMEEEVSEELPNHLVFEIPIKPVVEDGVKFVGTADCVDVAEGVVYDFKSRASWYRFNPPTQRHLDQLHIYMKALGLKEARVVYINKTSLEVKTYPEEGTFEFDPVRYEELVEKAREVRDSIDKFGVAESEEEIDELFPKCGCFICNVKDLVFDHEEEEEGM